ncbi:hypothetical protein CK203_064931 [Vitis vinifera]|uniref:Uncharacterized protein n=1 Tax=Vitis vinifera TaxID=29760 RepID=A0A438FQ13_VITVI|nr:hypothetical protein CK203_064931 [Vitis vinifera]
MIVPGSRKCWKRNGYLNLAGLNKELDELLLAVQKFKRDVKKKGRCGATIQQAIRRPAGNFIGNLQI